MLSMIEASGQIQKTKTVKFANVICSYQPSSVLFIPEQLSVQNMHHTLQQSEHSSTGLHLRCLFFSDLCEF